ncbi:MAG TPA: TonB-dependent receptor plug domain-containing protein, partial [Acetobacteraceae bacterium]
MRRMLLALLTLPAAAQAQTTPDDPGTLLPEQVVTATRIPTPATQIAAGTTVIDRATIQARGYTSLAEALTAVPGLRVVQSGGLGGNASVFIRGTNSNHVLVLRDGMPVADPSDPGGQFNFGVDTLGDVERIEVVRGPMSSLYGSGAIGGVINLITRRGAGVPKVNLEIAGGLPRAVRGVAGVSGASGMVDYSLNVEGRDERGFDTTPRRLSVYNGRRNGYRAALGSLEIGVTPAEGTRASVYLRGRTSSLALDSLGFPSYDAALYRGRDDAVYGRAGITSKLFGGALETGLFVGQVRTDRRYDQPLEAADPNQNFGTSRYHGR